MSFSHVLFQFIEPERDVPNINQIQPASYVRKVFNVNKAVRKATLYTTALGVYEPYINGTKVEKAKLMPGFTNYNKRVQYFETDVTKLLQNGTNVIAAVVGDGWYRGALGAYSKRAFYGDKVRFAASLEMQDEDGTISWVYTDEGTKATQDGPIVGNDIKTFEIVDMTKELEGWNEPTFDDSSWHLCKSFSYEGQAIPLEGEKILEHEKFTARIMITPNGETVLDFGQNISGHVEFAVKGEAGHVVKLEMGETLDEHGNFSVKNLTEISVEKIAPGMEIPNSVLGQTLYYKLKQGAQSYKSTFLVSGFRYVRLSNWPEEVKPENFTAIAIYADMKYESTFSCSNEMINKLVSNVRWSQKANFVDVPTDCPTRERAGWTGDVNVFAETACYLADTKRQIIKWLGDFIGLQKEDGSLPFIVPEVPMPRQGADMQNLPYSSAGWSDALINVPMILYQFYGDEGVIKLVYESAKKYVNYNALRAKGRHKMHFYKRGKHYQYILDTGYHWGEWLEPGGDMTKDAIKALMFPDAEVATAWFFYSCKQVSEMAAILKKPEDQKKYADLADKIRKAYQKEFLRRGKVTGKRQCRYVRPLYMGLVDEKNQEAVAGKLNQLCINNGYKIGTGFLTTYKILQTLSKFGYRETAYRILTQEKCPGWMYEINQGATTVWENWMGINEEGIPKDSQNHYAMGAVVAWLFSEIGGIKPLEPGFAKVQIAPQIPADLAWSETSYESVRGNIYVRWERGEKNICFKIILPDGVAGVLVLPDGTTKQIAGHQEYSYDLQCGK